MFLTLALCPSVFFVMQTANYSSSKQSFARFDRG